MADLSQAMQNGPGFAYTLESFVAALRADRPGGDQTWPINPTGPKH